MNNQIYGWFDDAGQPTDKPTCDPPHDGPCLYCGRAITADDVRTHSLMYASQYAARSYFYRTHKSCAIKDESQTAVDGVVFNMIERNGD